MCSYVRDVHVNSGAWSDLVTAQRTSAATQSRMRGMYAVTQSVRCVIPARVECDKGLDVVEEGDGVCQVVHKEHGHGATGRGI